MNSEEKLRAVRKGLGRREQITKRSEVVFVCPRPKCNHPDPKLSVNLESDWFHCWVCDWGGKNLAPLMSFRGETTESRQYRSEILKERKPKEPPKQYDVPRLPEGFRSLSEDHASPDRIGIRSYLISRGLTDFDIARWRLGYTEFGEFRHHVVIPSYDEFGEINFVTARKAYSDTEPRYRNGNFDKNIIFNDLMVDWERPVTLIEGFFDAMRSGENSIPILGVSLDEEGRLFEKIVQKNVDVYLALDPDALRRQKRIMNNMLSYGVTCRIVDLTGWKDPGSMNPEEFAHRKASARPVHSKWDVVRMRLGA